MRVDVVNVNILSQRIGELASISHGGNLKRSSVELTKDLWEWGHLTPFEFQVWIFKIEAPIFVARQVMRYRTGAFVERSLRYASPISKKYFPASAQPHELDAINSVYEHAFNVYEALSKSLPREVARTVLPLGTYTEFVWKIDTRNLYHFLEQRLSPHTQAETREFAKMVLREVEKHDLLIYGLFVKSLEEQGIPTMSLGDDFDE